MIAEKEYVTVWYIAGTFIMYLFKIYEVRHCVVVMVSVCIDDLWYALVRLQCTSTNMRGILLKWR